MDKRTEKQDLRKPEYFVNRELSHLEFNRRVLSHAADPNNPLLSLNISSINPEFFRDLGSRDP